MTPDVFLGTLAAFAESMLGIGFLVPGELAVSALAIHAHGGAHAALLIAAVAIGACCGDHVNYVIGRRFGPRLATSRIVQRMGAHHWDRGTGLIQRHGTGAIAISRLMPGIRTLMPAIAGVADLTYARFLLGSSVGALLWAIVWVTAGTTIGTLASSPVAVALAAAGAALALCLRRVVLRRRTSTRNNQSHREKTNAGTDTAPRPGT
ncbi:DedA family protein [Demequina iriomotensis]|uniref:DedA family protein n=1 Tax=Demequina iriomotensis TaxID=1536641 RepID=UPI0007840F0A|nr:DedA family protein [Demequina iriomotensis]